MTYSLNKAIVDASALIAALDKDDPDHASVLATLARRDVELVVPALIITETCYHLEKRFGPRVEAQFVRNLTGQIVEPPADDDWSRIGELIERYADFPLGVADASIVALAERIGCRRIVTLDRRHFLAVRPAHTTAFVLMPDA